MKQYSVNDASFTFYDQPKVTLTFNEIGKGPTLNASLNMAVAFLDMTLESYIPKLKRDELLDAICVLIRSEMPK